MAVQILKSNDGTPEFAVIPYDEYLRVSHLLEDYIDTDIDTDESDIGIPHEVAEIVFKKNVSVIAAWRIHCGLNQKDAAKKLGITQPALSQIEKSGSKPKLDTREKLAKIYNCKPEQLLDI